MEKQLERLRKIHQYIKSANTGTPQEFAEKLNICQSQLYNILDDLKIKGFPIIYSRISKSYIYSDDCHLEIIFSVHLLTGNDKIIISGRGKNNSLLQCY